MSVPTMDSAHDYQHDRAQLATYARCAQKKLNAKQSGKLFNNGGNRAIRIPKDFECKGNEATIRMDGDQSIVEPVCYVDPLAVLATRASLDYPFPDVHETALPRLDDPSL